MTTLQFVVEWALRSSILILAGALLLWTLRVKDPSIRLAAWTAMLLGSLLMPALSATLPPVSMSGAHPRIVSSVLPGGPDGRALPSVSHGLPKQTDRAAAPFDWARAALMPYFLIAMALLLRLCVGLAMGARLLHTSSATGQSTEGIEIRESRRIAAPVTLGIARPAIVLPPDWRRWEHPKLDAIFAHERSHIRRRDPAVQLLSAVHRALLWFSPLSWFLHQRIVRVAEEASDDAAVAVMADRTQYAELLLEFMQRGVRNPKWQGVTMARYGRQDRRIHRILDGRVLSRGVTRWTVAAILTLGSPLAWLVAAARPNPAPTIPQAQTFRPSGIPSVPPGVDQAPTAVAQAAAAPAGASEPAYVSALGNVAADTVTIKPRVDGQLMSLSFKEGDLVQAGQLVATIDPRPYQLQYDKAENQLEQDQGQLAALNGQLKRLRNEQAANVIPLDRVDRQLALIAEMESHLKADQFEVNNAKLQLTYTQIMAPITGIAGLRLIGIGNVVHAADAAGILTIAQLHPIAVLFTIPQEVLPEVRGRLTRDAGPRVEVWNRDSTSRLAVGHLTAMDNQIDPSTGTVKLKATFDNNDGALFPNQFVNVRLFLK
jgi:RND family efflux transporter MFP subunit